MFARTNERILLEPFNNNQNNMKSSLNKELSPNS